MLQQQHETSDDGVTRAFIVRLRREPGNVAWRVQVIDVHSGAATALSLAPEQCNDTAMSLATALAAAIEQLLES